MSSSLDVSLEAQDVPLSCMEIWGGNRNAQEAFPLPGLDAWLRARAYSGTAGGDIHYLSTCGHSAVLRFAIADVAGHGAEVMGVATRFKRLITKHINKLDQSRLAKALNAEFLRGADAGEFVTTILTSYYRPTGHLVVCNAGHPRPLLFRDATQSWELLDYGMESQVEKLMNIPLGIVALTDYYQFAVRLYTGDFVVLYSDGLSDVRRDGVPLGEQGLLEMVRELRFTTAAELGEGLTTALGLNDPNNTPIDDETLIVLAPKEHEPPRFSFSERVKAMAKTLGIMRIR